MIQSSKWISYDENAEVKTHRCITKLGVYSVRCTAIRQVSLLNFAAQSKILPVCIYAVQYSKELDLVATFSILEASSILYFFGSILI
jgi:hypothetical protein